MLTAIKDYYKNYFNYMGQSSIADYWFAILWNIILFFLLSFVTISFFINTANFGYFTSLSDPFTILSLMFSTASLFLILLIGLIFLPTLSLTTRRLRDTGFNTTGIIIYFVIVFITNFFTSALLNLMLFVLNIWLFTRPTNYFIGKNDTLFK